ncbi:anti-sigma factor family protein [Streptomyces shenzhenensis]|uniref:anti-sigma factor family protein n=1 Tax=Streptomyces shenzhenensis TaxID=943815 RepID=UPI003D8F438E
MSGSRPKSAQGHLAEEHLGDRLSALVDGELGHDARERVLAHLATCARCKAEADAQRQLKNVFAESAPPPPSESFLARLQGLPGSGGPDGGSPLDGALSGGSTPGVFGSGREGRFEFDYVPARPDSPRTHADRGFRIHPVGRPDAADRHASRGMRFAFVAAGAVSLAAVALGGMTTGIPGDAAADARGGPGSVTPTRTAGTGAATTSEAQRRRPVGPLLMQGTPLGETPIASTSVSAPLLPGVPAPATGQALTPLLTQVEADAVAMSPLIRSFGATPPISLISWSTAPGLTSPGLLAAPDPDPTPAPSPSSSSPSAAVPSSRPAR